MAVEETVERALDLERDLAAQAASPERRPCLSPSVVLLNPAGASIEDFPIPAMISVVSMCFFQSKIVRMGL
jgi:hypothetical protein